MKCSICTNEIDVQANGYEGGHNALPLSSGRCCTKCNDTEVIPMRMAFIASGRPIPTVAIKDILKRMREQEALVKVSLKNLTKEINERKNK
jgi:hypothetical protein|tara:strand:+ start:617 stop:889 length:273 start_codon:yes stop_codon:yes gene_type:complete